jgi:hypothetical protein
MQPKKKSDVGLLLKLSCMPLLELLTHSYLHSATSTNVHMSDLLTVQEQMQAFYFFTVK